MEQAPGTPLLNRGAPSLCPSCTLRCTGDPTRDIEWQDKWLNGPLPERDPSWSSRPSRNPSLEGSMALGPTSANNPHWARCTFGSRRPGAREGTGSYLMRLSQAVLHSLIPLQFSLTQLLSCAPPPGRGRWPGDNDEAPRVPPPHVQPARLSPNVLWVQQPEWLVFAPTLTPEVAEEPGSAVTKGCGLSLNGQQGGELSSRWHCLIDRQVTVTPGSIQPITWSPVCLGRPRGFQGSTGDQRSWKAEVS